MPVTFMPRLREIVQRSAFYCGLGSTEIVTGIKFTEEQCEQAWAAEGKAHRSFGVPDSIRCTTYAEARAKTLQQISEMNVDARMKEQMKKLFDALPVYLQPFRGHGERVVAEILGDRVAQALGLPQSRDALGPLVDRIASRPGSLPSRFIQRGLEHYLLYAAAHIDPLPRKDFQHSRPEAPGLDLGLQPPLLS
jgi:hypothetical protein